MAEPAGPGAAMGADAAPRFSRAREFKEVLGELTRMDGVRGGLMVAPDGLVLTAELPACFPVEAVGALAATLARELELGPERDERRGFRTALFSADDGTIFVGGSPVGYLILLGDRNVNLASVRIALRKAVDRLHGTWQTPSSTGAA